MLTLRDYPLFDEHRKGLFHITAMCLLWDRTTTIASALRTPGNITQLDCLYPSCAGIAYVRPKEERQRNAPSRNGIKMFVKHSIATPLNAMATLLNEITAQDHIGEFHRMHTKRFFQLLSKLVNHTFLSHKYIGWHRILPSLSRLTRWGEIYIYINPCTYKHPVDISSLIGNG